MEAISMQGRIALVTGGGAGIGRAIAESFARLGAMVIVADNDTGHLKQVQRRFREQNWDLHPVECDVRRADSVRELVGEIETRHAGLDVLVNNVGDILGVIKPLERMTDEDIEAVYQVVLRHVLVTTREAIPLLKRRAPGGSIITISSIEGYRGLPLLVPYATFKLASRASPEAWPSSWVRPASA